MDNNIIIDCDPGLDDAVALLCAFGTGMPAVQAITTVTGNVPGVLTAKNARIIRKIAGREEDIPIYAGAPGPILRQPVTAEDFHGATGLGDFNSPEPGKPLARGHAVNALISLCRKVRKASLTLVVTGPMTNIALALIMAPDIKQGIAEIIVMAGADREGGNITPYAEFNVFADPHAAACVFQCGLPIRCLGLDVTHKIRITATRLARIRTIPNQQAQATSTFMRDICNFEQAANGAHDAPLHDPSTIIALIRPDLFTGRRAHISVVTETGAYFGRTIPRFAEDGPVLWYEDADADGVFDTLAQILERY